MPAACPSCESEIEVPDTRFCSHCGHDLSISHAAGQDPFDGLIGQTVEGRYRVIERVGTGGMGIVYRVEHVRMGKVAAMKVLRRDLADDNQAAKRFRREVETVAKLDHPNIVQTFDFGEWHGLLYLVMEFIRGRDMAAVLKREGPMPPARALPLFIEVCAALEEAHHHGIIHRDLKPDNILVLETRGHGETVKVLDFGLAKLMERPGLAEVTGAGSLIGTPYYMAPEQVRSEMTDARTDIYNLGATLYRMLTGTPVFQADTPMAILTRHLNDDVQPPSLRAPDLDLPIEIDHVVLKALAKSPANRFSSAAEMKAALEEVLGYEPGKTPRPSAAAAKRGATGTREGFQSLGELASAAQSLPSWVDNPVRSTSDSLADVSTESLDGEDAEKALRKANELRERKSRERRALAATVGNVPSLADLIEPTPGPGSGSDASSSERATPLRREDVDAFERQMRRRKRGAVFLAFTVLAAAGGAGWFVLGRSAERAGTLESEPNNSPASANLLKNSTAIYGNIDEPASDRAPDFDYFRVPAGSGKRAITAELSAVAGIDLVLELYDSAGKQLGKADGGKEGVGEILGPVLTGPLDAYVGVRSVWVEGSEIKSSESPYVLTVTWEKPKPDWELEPNSDPAEAKVLTSDGITLGRLTGPDDLDAFVVRAPVGSKIRIELRVPDKLDGRIVNPGEKTQVQIDAGGPGKTETLEFAIGPSGERLLGITEGKRARFSDPPDRTQPYQLQVSIQH